MYGEQGLRGLVRRRDRRGSRTRPARRRPPGRCSSRGICISPADRRQREPYVNHLLRVALRITCHYGVGDIDVICAALLHDAVEDHAADLAAGGLARGCRACRGIRPAAAGVVDAVTNPDWVPGVDRDQQYRAHVADSLAASPWARVIKASDFTDNGVGLIHTSVLEGCQARAQVRAAAPRAGQPHRLPGHAPAAPGQARIRASSSPPRNDSPIAPDSGRDAGGPAVPGRDYVLGGGSAEFPDWPYPGPDCLPRRTCGDARNLL